MILWSIKLSCCCCCSCYCLLWWLKPKWQWIAGTLTLSHADIFALCHFISFQQSHRQTAHAYINDDDIARHQFTALGPLNWMANTRADGYIPTYIMLLLLIIKCFRKNWPWQFVSIDDGAAVTAAAAAHHHIINILWIDTLFVGL